MVLQLQPKFVPSGGSLQAVLEPSADVCKPLSKIIATLGPATRSPETLRDLLNAGVSAVRFDLAWGPLEYHLTTLANLKKAVLDTGHQCACCLDVSGRTCSVLQPYSIDERGWPVYPLGRLRIARGQRVIVTAAPGAQLTMSDDPKKLCVLPIPYAALADSVGPGDELDVGRYLAAQTEGLSVRLKVSHVEKQEIHCVAEAALDIAGWTTVRSIQQDLDCAASTAPPMSEEDVAAIAAFHQAGALDFLILGDIDSAADVTALRHHLDGIDAVATKILAKLQSVPALLDFGNIAALSDGMLIIRGALGMHVAPEKMAIIQKRITNLCNLMGKPCFVSRVMDSMQEAPRCTRAEATDVANSVIDGADGFLLGAETVRGEYPVICVQTVFRICREAEKTFDCRTHYEKLAALFGDDSDEAAPTWAQKLLGIRSTLSMPGSSRPDSSATLNEIESARASSSEGRSAFASGAGRSAFAERSDSAGRSEGSSATDYSIPSGRSKVFKPQLSTLHSVQFSASTAGEGGAALHGSGAPVATNRVLPPIGSIESIVAGMDGARAGDSPPFELTETPSMTDVNGSSMTRTTSKPPLARLLSEDERDSAKLIPRGASWGSLNIASPTGTPKGSAHDLSHMHASAPSGHSRPRHTFSSNTLAKLGVRVHPGAAHAFSRSEGDPTNPQELTFTLSSEEAAASSAVLCAIRSNSRLLLVITSSGRTAALVAKYKPPMPIVAVVSPKVVRNGVKWRVTGGDIARQCCLLRGVMPMMASAQMHGPSMLAAGLKYAHEHGMADDSDNAVCVVRVNTLETGTCLTVQTMNVGEQLGHVSTDDSSRLELD